MSYLINFKSVNVLKSYFIFSFNSQCNFSKPFCYFTPFFFKRFCHANQSHQILLHNVKNSSHFKDREVFLLKSVSTYLRFQAIVFFSSLGLIYGSTFLYYYAYSRPRKIKVNDKLSAITKKIQDWSLFIVFVSFSSAILFIGFSMFYISRVIFSISIKGGTDMILIKKFKFAPSYQYFSTIQVPVDHISCQTGRFEPGNYFILQIKGYWKYFLVDKTGYFPNPSLFDSLIALKRKF